MGERLTRDDVIDAAVAIVESEGLDALSMRTLSEKLGVAVTSIYWHVGKKEAVLDALVDRMSAAIVTDDPSGSSPRERISEVARSVQNALEAHGQLVAIAYRRGKLSVVFAPARRSLAVELYNAGLRGEPLARAVSLLLQYVAAYCTTRGAASRAPEPDVWIAPLWDHDTPIDDAAALALAEQADPAATFEHGLDILVRALIASA